jgi:hypothetical protein
VSPVLVSVVSALSGILAGLLPSLFVSERRRRLRYLREESELYNSLTDDETKAHLAKAMRATSRRYAEIAAVTHLQHVKRQARSVVPYAAGVIGSGILLQVMAIWRDGEITWLFIGGLAVMTTGLTAISLMVGRISRARLEDTLRKAGQLRGYP